jgi:glutamyl-tRNA synthetase
LLAPVRRQLDALGVTTDRDLAPLIDAVKARSRTVTHIAEQVAVRLERSRVVRDAKAAQFATKLGDRFAGSLRLAAQALDAFPLGEWDPAALEAALKALADEHHIKLGELMQPIRIALTGGTVSEPVPELLAVVGREESLARIRAAA